MDPPADVVYLILGGAGFIGSQVAAELVRQRKVVIVADRQPCAFLSEQEICAQAVYVDLRQQDDCEHVFGIAAREAQRLHHHGRVWVFLFAADMGGMGYIASNENSIMLSNTLISANTVAACLHHGVERLFLASSACVYPVELQSEVGVACALSEELAWPASPQDGYGLEKLYGEQIALSAFTAGLQVRIARFHNVYGPSGTFVGGREKSPAAFLRKALFLRELDAALPGHGHGLEVWGDGSQVRTYCYITDAVKGVLAVMCSDVTTPVNIGSDETVTVKELALLAGNMAGFARIQLEPRLTFQPAGPTGVQSRSADITKAALDLKWAPAVPLALGLKLTHAWMESEVNALRNACDGIEGRPHHLTGTDSKATEKKEEVATMWHAFLCSGLTSPHMRAAESVRFGLLIPITSRHRGQSVATSLRAFLESLRATTSSDEGVRAWQFDIIFGVDAGDAVCDPLLPGALDLPGMVRAALPLACAVGRVTARVRSFHYPSGSVCRIWSDLAADAFASGDDFAVLLGDDVLLQSHGWPDVIWHAFHAIARDTGLPFGFACVAFADDAFPGFPTFPVLHRTHAAVFGGRIFPTSFKNQDADPFLFQLYRAFGAARLDPRARLTNTIGGGGDARYEKRPVSWTGTTLHTAREAAGYWLELHQGRRGPSTLSERQPVVTLDVVVPTYRVPRPGLETILTLQVPHDVSTQFTIVCDRPEHAESAAIIAALQSMHRDNPMVRIRTNTINLGAGPSRNRGLAESAADWVLFLDDDVVPDPGIIGAYAAAIRAHPHATGFIGHSVLPKPVTSRQAAVHIAGVAYFWGIAKANPTHTDLPWGVTANLCVRRPAPGTKQFNGDFPKTGGGEDIDFCLRLREHMRALLPGSEGFVAVPDAVVTHPWWDGGVPHYSHFGGWAEGDGHLIDLFPALTYRNLPDLTETLMVLSTIGAAQAGMRAALSLGLLSRLPLDWLVSCSALSTNRALATTAAVAGACIVGDLVVDAWLEFAERPSPECTHLPLTTRMGGVIQGLLIRTISEAGRLMGHALRGRLSSNFGVRFNWFGYMWPGAPAVERREAARRSAARTVVAAAAVALLTRLYRYR